MALNEDRDKSKDQIVRINLRTARAVRHHAERTLQDANDLLDKALRAYEKHFGTKHGTAD